MAAMAKCGQRIEWTAGFRGAGAVFRRTWAGLPWRAGRAHAVVDDRGRAFRRSLPCAGTWPFASSRRAGRRPGAG